MLLFAAIFLPLTLKLGFWQLHRAEEKRQLLAVYQQREMAAPVALGELPAAADHFYVRAVVVGRFDNSQPLLLDNRVRHGRPGYELISPFKTAAGDWLLVNRGWLAGGLDRQVLPQIAAVDGQQTIVGYLYRSPGEQVMLGEDLWSEGAGPRVIQNASPDKVAGKLGLPLYPYSLRLDADQPGAMETGWMIVNVQPGKHTAYAVQWFALAITLVLLTIFANSNLGSVIRRRGGEQ